MTHHSAERKKKSNGTVRIHIYFRAISNALSASPSATEVNSPPVSIFSSPKREVKMRRTAGTKLEPPGDKYFIYIRRGGAGLLQQLIHAVFNGLEFSVTQKRITPI